MEQYIAHSRTFATYVAAGSLAAGSAGKDYYETLPKVAETLSKLQWNVLDVGMLTLLEGPHQSLGILGVLAAKSLSTELGNNLDIFMTQFKQYLDNIEPNLVRLCPSLLTLTCQKLCDALITRGNAIRGISLVGYAIQMIRTSPRQITCLHAILCELCLGSLNPKAALPYLIDDIEDFSSELKAECKNLLLFFYYGGMIFAELKRYNQALFYLEACIQVPCLTLSHIMLDAYKKYILLSLIQKGEEQLPPKPTYQTITRILKPNATAYTELATAFKTHSPTELQNVINRQLDTFRRDINYGLVKQVKTALTKLNIRRLTKTFLTLSLSDVAARVQLTGGHVEAEKLILSMIKDEEIYAKINQRDGMVVFMDNKEKYASAKMLQKMETQISVCVGLNKRLSELNEKLATNPEYVSKVSMSTNEEEGISSSKGPSQSSRNLVQVHFDS